MRQRTKSGFTLAEVAVTIVIVGIGLVYVLQGINTAKITAAHTRNKKIARDLALLTLGEIESGLYWEDMDDRMSGSYADQDYPEFFWEVTAGESNFTDRDDEGTLEFDSYEDRRRREEEEDDDEEDEDEDASEPFEKVRIRVTFPKLGEFPDELTLERWIPWAQVYGEDEEEPVPEDGGESGSGSGSSRSGTTTTATGSGGGLTSR